MSYLRLRIACRKDKRQLAGKGVELSTTLYRDTGSLDGVPPQVEAARLRAREGADERSLKGLGVLPTACTFHLGVGTRCLLIKCGFGGLTEGHMLTSESRREERKQRWTGRL